jgi:DNA-binding MarR family transcriptional regulator
MNIFKFVKKSVIQSLNPLELRLLLDLYDIAEGNIIQNFRITEYVQKNKDEDNGGITSRTTVTNLLKSLEDKNLIEKRVKRVDILPII